MKYEEMGGILIGSKREEQEIQLGAEVPEGSIHYPQGLWSEILAIPPQIQTQMRHKEIACLDLVNKYKYLLNTHG